MITKSPKRILRIDSSAQTKSSLSRKLTNELITALSDNSDTEVTVRDVSDGIPFVDNAWVTANFTKPDERTTAQREKLSYSDTLVDEIEAADTLVIGLPIYNFNLPASLKAWIDMIARVHRTFKYTENGPVGLMKNKQAYIVMASGGTKLGSDIDFATPYLLHILKFIGITDVTFIDGSTGNPEAIERAQQQIKDAA